MREFGLVVGAMFALVFGMLLPWVFGLAWPRWPWVVFAVLGSWSLLHPASLRPVHAGWMKLAGIIGAVNNCIILAAVFFLMITPFGWLRRLGGDPMARRTDRAAPSYRKAKQSRAPASFERPY